MNFDEYENLAMRTDDESKYNGGINRLINGLMGLNGEAGEAIDLLKKALFQGHELKKERLVEELGDCLWYLTLTARTIGVKLEDIANANILKLVKRFPDGFSEHNSVNRDNDIPEERPVPGPEATQAMEAPYDPNGEPFVPEVQPES